MTVTNDLPQATHTLEDVGTQGGLPLHKVLEGDAAAAKNASAALTAKDAAGDLQYPRVNAQRELVVSTTSADNACLNATGKVAGNKVTEQVVLTIVLQASLEYKKIGWLVSCFRQSEFRIVHVADVGVTDVETEIATMLVAPNDVTDSNELECLSFTSGATGVQELRLVGINKDAISDLRGTVTVLEQQAS